MAAGDLITRDGQLEWGGLLLGSGTPYRWSGDDDSLTGWEDLPGLTRGSVLRPNRHGSWPGRSLAQERVVTWRSLVTPPITEDFGPVITALRRATRIPTDAEETPLVIRVHGGEALLAFGQVSNRIVPNNRLAKIGRGTAVLQWTCADPRRYSVTEHVQSIPQPSGGTGLVYPLAYPLDYGAAGESGSRICTNAGDVDASPLITLTGPCTTPSITNVNTQQVIELGLALAASETVVIDTNTGTVELDGANRLFTLTNRSVPPELFALPDDSDSEIAFRASAFGGGAVATITWRDAYL